MSTRAQHRPVTPMSAELYHGLQQVARHNAGRDSPADSAFASPAQLYQAVSPHLSSSYPSNLLNGSHAALYDSNTGLPYGLDQYPLEGLTLTSTSQFTTRQAASTPTTPRQTPADIRRTRSGRPILRSSSPAPLKPTGITKSPRIKTPKLRSTSSAAAKTPKIDRPLSELTKDMGDRVPVRDMEAWANRPASVRQQEVERRNGYVTRPMNSFMLYRSAYAERTKQWCLQNNHQVVSSVSGASWPLEPESVRNHYDLLAKIERDNHARAHPNYKFSPSKNGPAGSSARKKGKIEGDGSDDDGDGSGDEATVLSESDAEWRPRHERSSTRGTSSSGGGVRKQHSLHPKDSTTYPSSYAADPFTTSQRNQGMNGSSNGNGMFFSSTVFDQNMMIHPQHQNQASSWATSAPSSYDDLFQQDQLDNLGFFHCNANGHGMVMHQQHQQQELPYYITGAGVPSAAPTFYHGHGINNATPSELMYMHSPPLGMQMPMNVGLGLHGYPHQQHMPTHSHSHNLGINVANNGMISIDTEMQMHEAQVDPMLLQLDAGMGVGQDMGDEEQMGMEMWSQGGGGGESFEEWMAAGE